MDYNYFRTISQANSRLRRDNDLRQGVLMNNFVKTQESFDSGIVIPKNTALPEDLYEKKESPQKTSNPFIPLIIAPVGILGMVALFTQVALRSLKLPKINKYKNFDDLINGLEKFTNNKSLPPIARNMNLKTESEFATYLAIQSPGKKTVLSALAVFAFSGAILITKSFVDGFKDIWVKKQDADIQKNLQERLIEVETRSFSGKNQIIRHLLNEKSAEISKILAETPPPTPSNLNIKGLFVKKPSNKLVFKGEETPSSKDKLDKNWIYIAAGGTTLLLSLIFARQTIKNISKTARNIENFKNEMDKTIKSAAKSSSENPENRIEQWKKLFSELKFTPQEAEKMLKEAQIPDEHSEKILGFVNKNSSVFEAAPHALGGYPGKISYYAYLDGIQGHFYNFLINPSHVTASLFATLMGVTGIGYIGRKVIEAIKEVQVKKSNADTELNLHKNLVRVELKNFLTKKNSLISPLMAELRTEAKINPDRERLKKLSANVLEEIKYGPPFVYS